MNCNIPIIFYKSITAFVYLKLYGIWKFLVDRLSGFWWFMCLCFSLSVFCFSWYLISNAVSIFSSYFYLSFFVCYVTRFSP